MVSIDYAGTEDIEDIRNIALISWPVNYHFLEEAQVSYMLEVFYNPEELKKLMDTGQEFLLLKEDEQTRGFAAFSPREKGNGVYKLNKLYLLPADKGKGWGKLLLDEVEKEVRSKGGSTLELNVNRYNPSMDFYMHLGYRILYEEDIPVGRFWMNDYVMAKDL